MILTRLRQMSLMLLSFLLVGVGFLQMFLRTQGEFPVRMMAMLGVDAALFLLLWALAAWRKPYASQTILPCVAALTGLGAMMITRIDQSKHTDGGFRQLLFVAVALVLCCILVVAMRDYRVLRRFSYASMAFAIVLLLLPVVPGLGTTINGARIWVKIPGMGTLQPGEFAKLFLAFFFAAYLFSHRDQLSVGGRKVLGLQLPRLRDLVPIMLVWLAAMGVLVLQHDLGTALMYFAMFVSMLYVATGRGSWIVIGLVVFAVGVGALLPMFGHVTGRVDAWLHPFDSEVYNRPLGGSYQLVNGQFGMASGGMLGTGLGQGHPSITPYANSDFIYASLGEELGLTGLAVVLLLYLAIIASGLLTAMKVKDGFGKLLASGLVFTMAFQVFTVVGGITRVIPLTGLTMPYMAAGGSSLIANFLLAALLVIISDSANRPDPGEELSDTFQYEAVAALRDRELREREGEDGGGRRRRGHAAHDATEEAR